MKRVVPLSLLMLSTTLSAPPDLEELRRMSARFAPVDVRVDTSRLSAGDRKALVRLIEAAHLIDDIFLTQFWSGNHALKERLAKDATPLGRARYEYFWLNKGPWSALDEHRAFLPGVPEKKLPGANFYPTDMTRDEFEKWAAALSADQRQSAQGFFTAIRRREGKLVAVPFSVEYADRLKRLAGLLRDAASATDNASLRRFLESRADAFLSNDYYASDVAWMDLDAPLDITIGPYETYNDEIFGYKASFEAYINLRDEAETKKVAFFAGHLQEIENHLPIDEKYRNPKLGAMAPIRVVNQIIVTGDAAHGIRTAAYNLPNDDRVVKEKGSKRVMLRNVQEAKFKKILEPIAARVLAAGELRDLSFDAFFTHILAHELAHGIGPQQVRVAGKDVPLREKLKELYGAIEEAKADITGLYMLQYMYDNKLLPGDAAAAERRMYTSFLASAFRTLRFGLKEAHGRGMALQFNYLADKGAFVEQPDGKYRVDFAKVKGAVRDLTREILTIEATGDYDAAKRMLDSLAKLRPGLERALSGLKDLPTDIRTNDVTAASLFARLRLRNTERKRPDPEDGSGR